MSDFTSYKKSKGVTPKSYVGNDLGSKVARYILSTSKNYKTLSQSTSAGNRNGVQKPPTYGQWFKSQSMGKQKSEVQTERYWNEAAKKSGEPLKDSFGNKRPPNEADVKWLAKDISNNPNLKNFKPISLYGALKRKISK